MGRNWDQEFFSAFGDPIFWFVFSIVILIAFGCDKTLAKAILIFLFVDTVVIILAKLIFSSPRPSASSEGEDGRLLGPLKYAFPSGHASVAFGILMVLIPLFWDGGRSFLYFLVSFVLVGLVCYSRIKLEKHWFVDIVGGIAVSAFISIPITLWMITNLNKIYCG